MSSILRLAVVVAVGATLSALSPSPTLAEFDPAKVAAEPASVAGHFPDPPTPYDTPAFASDKRDFTSQAELMAYVEGLRSRDPHLRVLIAGRSQRGREMPLLVFTESGVENAAAVRDNGRPTAVIIGQQHGNEPAGGEAALVLARRLADGDLRPLLQHLNVLILPRANPDGAASFVRVSADGTDLNRDHLLLTTPEVRAIAKVMRDYQPDLVVDAHEFTVMGRWIEKFDAIQSYDALIQYATVANLPDGVTKAAQDWFFAPAVTALTRERLSWSWYFTTGPGAADKKVSMGGVQPDTGRNVAGLRNAVSFLIETRGVGLGRAHLARRVHTHEAAIASLLESAAAHAAELRALTRAAGEAVSRSACTGSLTIAGAPTMETKTLTFLDPRTGEDKPIVVPWASALTIQTVHTRPRPCGYAFDATQAQAAEQLRLLGVTVQRLAASAAWPAERYVVDAVTVGKRQDARGDIEDAGGSLSLQVRTDAVRAELPEGTYYVSLAQPLANLAAAALEPDSQNSFAANRLLALDAGVGLLRMMTTPAVAMTSLPPE